MSLKRDDSDDEALAVKVKTEDEIALQQDTEDEEEDDEDKGDEQSNKRQKKELDAFLNADIDKISSAAVQDENALKKLEELFTERLQRTFEEVKRKRLGARSEEEEEETQAQRSEEEKKKQARQKLLDENICMLCKKNTSDTMSCVEFMRSKVDGGGVKICEDCYGKAVPKGFQKKCHSCDGFLHQDLGEGLCSAHTGCDNDFHTCCMCKEFFCVNCCDPSVYVPAESGDVEYMDGFAWLCHGCAVECLPDDVHFCCKCKHHYGFPRYHEFMSDVSK